MSRLKTTKYRLRISFVLGIYLFIFSSATLRQPEEFTLRVRVTGFTTDAGKAYIGLYRKGDKFPEMNAQFIGKIVEINNGVAEFSFAHLPKNDYALAVYHDKNKNGKLDKNLVGMPTEKYGFSNNARETFSAPSFEQASIRLNSSKTVSIVVK
jgi:uncharacterized protein (DUF2141 family)